MTLLLVIVRSVHFGACLLLVAGFAIQALVLDGASGAIEPARRRGAWTCLAAAFISGFCWLWLATAEMSGAGLVGALPLLRMVLGQTAPGHVWLVRAGSGALVAIALGAGWTRAAFAAAFALLVSVAWLGHSGALAHGGAACLFADVFHLGAASVWPAGLLPFALGMRRILRSNRPECLPMAGAAVRRFSDTSLAAVAALSLSGLVQGCFLVGSFRGLATTRYGQLLLLKLLLFASALSLGAWNRFRYKPALLRPVAGLPETVALRAIQRNILIEFWLGAAIVSVVGLLGITPPPR